MGIQKFATIQDFYKFVDGLSDKLQENNEVKVGQKISYLVHKVAWTTSTELLGELHQTINKIDRSKISDTLNKDIDICLDSIKSYLGN